MATKKLPYRTRADEPLVIESNPGEKIENVVAMKINDDGTEEFYIAGKTNTYEQIQAFAEDSKIENILAKVMATGDMSILQQKKGEFLDLTEMPKDIFEAQKKITEAEKTFAQLPLEVRKEYNNNFNEYLADAGSEKWMELVGLKEKKIEPDPEPIKNEGGDE